MNSFLEGIARIFDISGSLNHYDFNEKTDAEAIYSDWAAVGEAIKDSIEKTND